MSSTLMTEPAAGWYHDPADAGAWRWWDGSSWTDHVRAADASAPAEPALALVPEPAFFPTGPSPVVDVQPEAVAPQTGPAVEIQPVPTHAPVFEQPAPVAAPVMPAPPVAGAATVLPAPPVVEAPVMPAPPVTEAPPAVVIEPVPTHPPVFEQPAPEPVTVQQPEPVSSTTIPQPGQVAPAPAAAAQTAGNVSLTPAIPITDQAYWHSAAAEKVDVPRLSSASTGAINVQRSSKSAPSYVRDWNDLGSANTPGVWLLAFSPLFYVGISILIAQVNTLSGGVFGRYSSAVAGLVFLGLNWIFAYADQKALVDRGYHKPSIAWMLLFPPIAYLIARSNVVKREGMAAWPPVLVYVLSYVALIAFAVLATATLLALAGVTAG